MNKAEGNLPAIDELECELLQSNYQSLQNWNYLIASISLKIRQSINLPEILQTTADEVYKLLLCDRVLLYKFELDWSGRVVVESVSNPQWSLINRVVQDACFKPSWIESYQESRFVAIADVEKTSLTPCYAEFLANFQVKANLVVPLLHASNLWGLLIAHNCTDPRQWQLQEIEGLQRIAVEVGIAIYQASLVEQLQAAKADLESQVIGCTQEIELAKQQNFQLAAIVESSQDAIISKTLDGIITSWNQAATKLFGYSFDEVIGKHVNMLIPSAQQSEEAQILQRIRQGHRVDTYETQRQCRDASLIDVDLTISPLFNENMQVVGASKIVRNISDRKQAEQELQSLSDRLKLALSAGEIGTWDLKLTEQEATWDEQMYIIYGFQHLGRAATYQDWREHVHPDDLQAAETAFQLAMQGKQDFDIEYRIVRDDGQQRWIKATALLQSNPQGEPIRITGINYDITDHKQIELDFKLAKNQLELLLAASSEGFWDWDLITGDVYFSPQWKAMIGYDEHELENSNEMWQSLIFEEDLAIALQLIEDYNNNKINQFSVIQKYHHKNGSTVHVLSRAINQKDEHGKVIRMIGSHLDMTQLVEIQEALKISKMQLSSVLDSSLNGIMAFRSVRDDQNKIIDFEWLISNPTACKIVGRSQSELIGHQLLVEMPGNRDEGLFDIYVQVVESGKPMLREFYYCRDGLDSWFENIAVKLGDGFAATFRDITSMKQAEQSFQQVNQELSDRLDDLKQRNAEMLLLSEISDFLQACLTVQEACAAITSLVQPLFPDCSGSIFITNPSRNQVENVASWGKSLHSKNDFHPQDCWGLRRGKVHLVGHDRLGLRCSHVDADAEIANTLCIPMIAQGETLGLFYLSTATSALSKSKQQLAKTVAEQVALAIANLNLRETLQNQSIRDALTGLFNRRYLEESLIKEVSRAQRNQHSIGIIMIDIDHFKKFNDTFGHDAGDYVLQAVGNLLKQSIRGSDIACRYGGEELTLIFPELSLQETTNRAEIIREAIAQLKLSRNGQFLGTLTASLGVATFPEHGTTGAAVIQSADAALYRAKAAGRNQVIVAP